MTRGEDPLPVIARDVKSYMCSARFHSRYVTSDESFNLTEPELPIFLRMYISPAYLTLTSQGALRVPVRWFI